MHMMAYFLIFISKVVENALATLRLIMVANGKKLLGAILQFVIAIVWVIVTGMVVVGVAKDPIKIVFFALGSLVGSYVGCVIEEKLAMGDNMLICITTKSDVALKIRKQGYAVTVTKGCGKEEDNEILFIVVPRKKRKKLVLFIKKMDPKIMIISENINTLVGGYK